MSNLSTLPKGDSAWLLRKSIERIIQQVSVLETNIGSSTTGNSSNTQIIFNDAGTLRGDAGLTYNKTTDLLSVGAATITGDLTVDTNVLKVNTTTNRVGINTTTPTQNLEITGSGNPLTADGCSAVRLNNTVSGRPAVVGVDDSQNFIIWNVGTEVSETIKFLTGGGNGKEQYRITHGGVFTWYDGAGGTRMTLNSTGLGVGDAPTADCKLTVRGGAFINRGATGGASQLLVSLAASSGGNFGQISNTGTRWALGYGSTLTTVGTEALIWDSSGNVGIGVTPSAWGLGSSGYRAFEIGAIGNSIFSATNDLNISSNAYYLAGWKYGASSYASQYSQGSGSHVWYTAPSGTAGNAITFTQAMTLDASGTLLVGDTSSQVVGVRASIMGSGGFAVQYTGSTGTFLHIVPNAANGTVDIKADARTGAYPDLTIQTSSTQRVRVKSTGQVRFVPLAADPAGAEAGDVYYNSTSNKLKCYNGTSWNDLF